jgi:CubicO group peptidase (beta-lactamase class C family)
MMPARDQKKRFLLNRLRALADSTSQRPRPWLAAANAASWPPRATGSLFMPPRLIAAIASEHIVEAGDPTPVPWWSFTKTVLAATALVLVARGRLALDEPLDARPFTLRQLLQHTTGLPDYGGVPAYHAAVAAGDDPWPADDLLHRAGADSLLFQPGEGWAYSNIGYLFVRQMIEATTGRPLGAALDDLVLGPLGVSQVAVAQTPADLAITAWGNAAQYHPGWVYHGLLIGPAASAALLLHRLLADTLLPASLQIAMTTRRPIGGSLPDRPWRSTGYGLGLMIGQCEVGIGETGRTTSADYIGHTGGGPGSSSAVYQQVDGSRAAAVFAAVEASGLVEHHAMALAMKP